MIELLICLAVMALLFALMAPAIESVRETSRALKCKNNLRQIAVAVQNYQTAHAVFPPGFVGVELRGKRLDDFSVIARVLPWLDQASVYKQIDLQRSNRGLNAPDPEFLQGMDQVSLPVCLCPSDSSAVGGRCSYSFSWGVRPSQTDRGKLAGAFVAHYGLRPAHFLDGLGNTVGISEKLATLGQDFDVRRDIVWVRPYAEPQDSPDAWAAKCASVENVAHGWYRRQGATWLEAAGNLYNHILGPNTEVVGCSVPNTYPPMGVVPARSEHPGGVHAAFMDGRVVMINEAIDVRTWQALGTRAGGESPGAF